MTGIITLAFGLIVTILFVFTVTILSKRTVKETKEVSNLAHSNIDSYKEELKQLKMEIKAKREELENLKTAVDGLQVRNNSSLPLNVENVLDVYEANGIKVSIDIIEDLCYLKLEDEKTIFNYIEKQRKAWKLENSKGVVKEVM